MTNAQTTDDPILPTFQIGDRVRKAREIAGLSQAELSKSLGINRNKMSSLEGNKFSPSLEQIRIVAEVTRVDYNWLLIDNSANTSRYPASGVRITDTGQVLAAV